MRPYHHYTRKERSILQNFHAAGKGVREIARETGKNPSSMSRELKRDGSYHACRGMSLYRYHRKSRVRKRRLSEGAARDYAAGKLRDVRPPQAVTERWSQAHPESGGLPAGTV